MAIDILLVLETAGLAIAVGEIQVEIMMVYLVTMVLGGLLFYYYLVGVETDSVVDSVETEELVKTMF